MIVIGLTGSIGMGKSTLARMCRYQKIPVFDADKEVHRLFQKNSRLIEEIGSLFPEAVQDGKVDRRKLGKIVFASPEKRHILESIVHPLIAEGRRRFLIKCRNIGQKLVVLDIPLLFEVGLENECDFILCADAPDSLQKQRVMRRKGMTEEVFNQIKQIQVPNIEKRQRADFLVQTGAGYRYTWESLAHLFKKLR